jgi:hypothetical protein
VTALLRALLKGVRLSLQAMTEVAGALAAPWGALPASSRVLLLADRGRGFVP